MDFSHINWFGAIIIGVGPLLIYFGITNKKCMMDPSERGGGPDVPAPRWVCAIFFCGLGVGAIAIGVEVIRKSMLLGGY
jgi:hypothetical protein